MFKGEGGHSKIWAWSENGKKKMWGFRRSVGQIGCAGLTCLWGGLLSPLNPGNIIFIYYSYVVKISQEGNFAVLRLSQVLRRVEQLGLRNWLAPAFHPLEPSSQSKPFNVGSPMNPSSPLLTLLLVARVVFALQGRVGSRAENANRT